MGFPGGPVVKKLPASAGNGFSPWSAKIPHVGEQLSPCTPTAEPALQNPRARLLRPVCRGAGAPC